MFNINRLLLTRHAVPAMFKPLPEQVLETVFMTPLEDDIFATVIRETEDAPKSTPSPYAFGLDEMFAGTIHRTKDVDVVRFSVERAGYYTITISSRNDNENNPLTAAKASAEDADGNRLDRFDDLFRNVNQLSFFSDPGEVTLKLAGDFAFGVDTGGYMISAHRIVFDERKDAPADISTSYSLEPDGSFTGQLSDRRDKDWIKVDLVKDQVYGFDLQRFGPWQSEFGVGKLSVFNAKGNEVKIQDFDTLFGQIAFQAQRSGTYFIEVADAGNTIDNSYTLNMFDFAVDEDEDAEGSNDTAYTIEIEDSFRGVLKNRDDVDRVAIELEKGHAYQFQLSRFTDPLLAEVSSPTLSLWTEDGLRLKSAGGRSYSGDTTARFDFVAQSSETYFLSVGTSRGKGVYQIETTELPSEAMQGDPGDDETTSNTLAAGSSFYGSIDKTGDQDWFKVTLKAGEISSFSVRSRASEFELDPEMTLYDEDGNILTYEDDADLSTDAEFEIAPKQDMDAFLAISSPKDLTIGDYKLVHRTDKVTGFIGGSEGADVLYASLDSQSIDGFGGDDQIFGNGGKNRLEGGAQDDLIRGGGGKDFLTGGSGADILYGDAGRDTLDGGSGMKLDLLYGGAGSDKLIFNDGNSKMYGQAGNDRFEFLGLNGMAEATGGSGKDTFEFLSAFRSADGLVTITDFQTGIDTLKISSNLIIGNNIEAHFKVFSTQTAEGLEIELKNQNKLLFQNLTDLDALISDSVLS